jgi:hypothetical protein
MDWQTVFFALGSVFLVGWLIFITVLIVSVLILYRKTRAIQETLSNKLHQAPTSLLPFLAPLAPLIVPLIMKLVFRRRR